MSDLRMRQHLESGEPVVEVWERGEFIAAIYPVVGCGFRIMSKYQLDLRAEEHQGQERVINCLNVNVVKP